jgi:hypothetical protein
LRVRGVASPAHALRQAAAAFDHRCEVGARGAEDVATHSG